MAGRKADGVGVIERAARGKPFAVIVARECDQVGDLFALQIDHGQMLTASQLKGGAGLRLKPIRHPDPVRL
jgi:hypothetical protein